jgi:hypothetical protein
MKITKNLNDEVADIVKEIALAKGLDKLDYNKRYNLYKVGSKLKSNAINIQEEARVFEGSIQLTGSENSVCLLVTRLRDWFRTSPIIACTKGRMGFIIETENSFYELKEQQ